MGVDLAGNLLKERLAGWIPSVIEAVNRTVEAEITEDEVRRYYRSDARLWGLMLRLRRPTGGGNAGSAGGPTRSCCPDIER